MSFALSVYSVLLAVPVPVPALVCFLVAHKRIQADKVKANFIGLKRRRTTTTGNEEDDDGDAIMLANCKTICLGKGRKKEKERRKKGSKYPCKHIADQFGPDRGATAGLCCSGTKKEHNNGSDKLN